MAQIARLTYEQFRFDVYLIKSATGPFANNPVIANFAAEHLAHEFAEGYTKKYNAQLCINDLRTDSIKYFGTFKAPVADPAWQPKESKVVAISKPIKTEEPVPVKSAPVVATVAPASKRDLATLLLRVIRDSKPLPARKIAEKAGVDYDINVKRVLRELGTLKKIVFDNGRWRKP